MLINSKEVLVYEVPKSIVNNILSFLDRVEYKGIAEARAVLEIVSVLNKPVEEKIIND